MIGRDGVVLGTVSEAEQTQNGLGGRKWGGMAGPLQNRMHDALAHGRTQAAAGWRTAED